VVGKEIAVKKRVVRLKITGVSRGQRRGRDRQKRKARRISRALTRSWLLNGKELLPNVGGRATKLQTIWD
jgi:hypothetical protein